MDIEDIILNNLKNYYTDAYNKRIHLDDIYKERVTINPKKNNSICIWNSTDGIINITNKCNHLLLYNCDNLIIHCNNFISGITCIKTNNSRLLFYKDMTTNIEMSQSFNINIRSKNLESQLIHKGIITNFIKSEDYRIIKKISINDGLFSNWGIKHVSI